MKSRYSFKPWQLAAALVGAILIGDMFNVAGKLRRAMPWLPGGGI